MGGLRVATKTGTVVVLDEGEVERFRSGLRGDALLPGDAGYDAARRVWNGVIDKHPAVIVRCAGAPDVVRAVDFARGNDLLVAVRGGGHNVAGTATCDRGLVVDLSPMRGVRVDPGRRTARAEGGATWADLDRETQAFGLATPGGVVSETGIGGLTLGGGIGWLRRKHGLSCDNLVSADVVTADGRSLTASETAYADLFWGIRGGGGNLGVVTSFEYRLHPVGPEVMFCLVFHPGEDARRALRFYREYAAAAPDEVTSFAVLGTLPHAEPFPEEARGRPYVVFAAMHAGPAEEGERATRPLRLFAEPLADFSGPMPYVEVQSLLDDGYPAGELRYYWKSLHLDGLGDRAIDGILAHAASRPSPLSTVGVWHMGGAVDRIGPDESAFGGRGSPFLLGVEANWEDPLHDAANVAWARGCVENLRPFSDGGPYLNFPGFLEDGEATLRAAFGANYARLAALKARYDPGSMFGLGPNIRPAET